jgi:hypothetical protein
VAGSMSSGSSPSRWRRRGQLSARGPTRGALVTARALPPPPSGTAASDPPASTGSDVPAAWMTWLTTEHYNLQTQRAATIGEANGRASIFLGALSAGLIALGFASTGHRTAGTTTFQVLVLSSLVVLGTITFLRCLQIAIDGSRSGRTTRPATAVYPWPARLGAGSRS